MDIASLTTDDSEEGVLVDAKQLYQHDPLFVLLKERWQLQDHWIMLGSAALPAVVLPFWGVWIAVSKEHSWTPYTTVAALLEIGVLFPLLFLLYLHLPAWLADLFNQLHANQVIGPRRSGTFGPTSYRDFIQLFTAWTDKWWWVVGAIALIAVYLCYRIALVEPSSHTIPLWLRCIELVVFMPLMYATFLTIARIVAAFVALNWLFLNFTILVRPLHPDGSGGLGALGRIIWVSVVMLLWDALLLYTGYISGIVGLFSSSERLLLSTIYLTLVPLIFIGWLLLPHMVMVKARNAVVHPLANELYQLMSQTTLSSHEDTETMKATTDRLIELQRRVEFLRNSFPTWPVEIQTIGRFVVVLLLPTLLPVVLPPLFSWIVGVLK